MTQPRERIVSSGFLTLFWLMAAALATCFVTGGYYWGQASRDVNSAGTRMDAFDKQMASISDAFSKQIATSLDNSERYTDMRIANEHDSEQRDVVTLGNQVSDVKNNLRDVTKVLAGVASDTSGIKATVQYLAGRKANQ